MVLSIFFESVVILDEILWSVWFERNILGANQMFVMIMYEDETNLVTFQFGGTSEGFGHARQARENLDLNQF